MGGATKFIVLRLLHQRPSLLRLASHSILPYALYSPSHHLGFPTEPSRRCLHIPEHDPRGFSSPLIRAPHPWPEWPRLVDGLASRGYSDRQQTFSAVVDDSFVSVGDLPEDFVRAAHACLAFARVRPNLLRLLSRKDIEVVFENGTPFLFKNAVDSTRRMRSFLGSGQTNVLKCEVAHTVDLMRFLLSYMVNPINPLESTVAYNSEFVESSVRNLLSELTVVIQYAQTVGPFTQNEMKRGKWICPRCNLMNFARNVRCHECEEARPKRSLTSRGCEGWECPRCDFFNYGRKMACLRCEFNRPREVSMSASLGSEYGNPASGTKGPPPVSGPPSQQFANPQGNSSSYALPPNILTRRTRDSKTEESGKAVTNKFEAVSKSGEFLPSETQERQTEKRQRAENSEGWFQRVAELHDATDLASAMPDEDFPELMSMHKGENRHPPTSLLNKRRPPLERESVKQFVPFPADDFAKKDKPPIDETGLGEKVCYEIYSPVAVKPTENLNAVNPGVSNVDHAQWRETEQTSVGSLSMRYSEESLNEISSKQDFINPQAYIRDNSPDFGKENPTKTPNVMGSSPGLSPKNTYSRECLEESAMDEAEPLDMSEEAKTKRWLQRVVLINDISELRQIPDEDFPSIMPMRKGENRFVVSKRKTSLERRLSSARWGSSSCEYNH